MLPVSLSFAAALALLNLWLGLRTSLVRMKSGTNLGDGGKPVLVARMRAQANFVEYSPFVLALVALLELAGQSRTILWAVAIAYLVGRIAHPFGMERPAPNPLRAGGIFLTWAVLLGLALWAARIAATPMPGAGHVTYF